MWPRAEVTGVVSFLPQCHGGLQERGAGQGVEARSSSHSGLGHTRVSTQEASGCSPAGSRICITHTWFLGQPRQSDQEATEPLPITLAGP